MNKWKITFVFLPLLMMMIHGFVPHSHASPSSHALICSDNASLAHRFFDLISVDIGVNHLKDYFLNTPQTIDQPVQLFIFHFQYSLRFAQYAGFLFFSYREPKDFPLHSLFIVGDVSRRGPPMV
jgi:hypothetical protein